MFTKQSRSRAVGGSNNDVLLYNSLLLNNRNQSTHISNLAVNGVVASEASRDKKKSFKNTKLIKAL